MASLQECLDAIEPLALDPDGKIQARLDNLTKPLGSLGRLEELARWYLSIRPAPERPLRKTVFVMAGDHGVARQGVSAFPPEVTPQMVLNFLRGGAAINVLARHAGARVEVVDCGVAADLAAAEGLIDRKIAPGTADFTRGPAMMRAEAVRSVEIGLEMAERAAEEGVALLAAGEMGIGNTTSATALLAAFTSIAPAEIAGRGTGVDDARFARKIAVIEAGLAKNRPDPSDALDVLAKVGGFEIGAMAGLFLGGACHRIPVLVDGFISGAAALVASRLAPAARGYWAAGHASVEPGHRVLLSEIGLEPLFDLRLRLGEGTGAALAMTLVEAGLSICLEMATFADAGVSEEEKG